MKKSCKYCGKIHDFNYECPKKPKRAFNGRYNDKDQFRSSYIWQKKREEIKQRDLYLCRICMDQHHNKEVIYNYTNLEVHHIVPLNTDYNKRLDNNNLITLCSVHHKEADEGKISADYLRSLIK